MLIGPMTGPGLISDASGPGELVNPGTWWRRSVDEQEFAGGGGGGSGGGRSTGGAGGGRGGSEGGETQASLVQARSDLKLAELGAEESSAAQIIARQNTLAVEAAQDKLRWGRI